MDLLKFLEDQNSLKENIGEKDKTVTKSESAIWITATCPARIDIAGGWSDTPPICYELGGKVVNIAIKINGEKPIGARVRKILAEEQVALKQLDRNPLILIKELSGPGSENQRVINTIKLNTIQDVMTFDQFFNPGSLVKAALICTNIVCDSRTAPSLEEQLLSKIGSGIEIETWSQLPSGSGLGTSSILASCIIAVLWKLTGRTFSKVDLVHATLYVEQVITTGGGYQDQVSGIYGGVNLSLTARCPSTYIQQSYTGVSDQGAVAQISEQNLQVQVFPIKVSPKDLELLMSRIVLLYTGTVRLAKNILQNVIRNWYSRNKPVVDCFHELLESSDKCCRYLVSGNIDSIGPLTSKYWEQKKILAPSCEPEDVKKFFQNVSGLISGGSMAGAGGGGFLFVILKPNSSKEEIIKIGKETFQDSFQVYDAEIDHEGIELWIGNEHKEIIA